MPSVLTEIGFMSNAKELAYMNSEKGQNELARMLCNAVKEYVNHINRMAGGVVEELPAEPVASTQKQEQKQEQIQRQQYQVQQNLYHGFLSLVLY
jgi:N-acetylmuramoyl-L-alanine amidase